MFSAFSHLTSLSNVSTQSSFKLRAKYIFYIIHLKKRCMNFLIKYYLVLYYITLVSPHAGYITDEQE